MAAEGEICVDEVWDRMVKKLEHMLGSFADNDVTHLELGNEMYIPAHIHNCRRW